MSDPKPIVIDKFPGTDVEANPLDLGKIMLETGVMWMPSGGNVYTTDGTYLQKRPGVTACTISGFSPTLPIYDVVRAKLVDAGTVGNDQLLLAWNSSGQCVNAVSQGTLPAMTLGAKPASAAYWVSDTNKIARLVVCGPGYALLTNSSEALIEAVVVPAVSMSVIAVPVNKDGTTACRKIAAWHKLHMFRAANNKPLYANNVIFSDFNKPVDAYPPLNSFDVGEEGQYGVIGMLSTGDILYLGKSGTLHMLTGSTADNFRLRVVSLQYGIGGIRGGDVIGPGAAVAFLTERKAPLGSTVEVPNPRNIGLLSGGELKVIGDRVLTYIRVGSDATIDTQVQNWSALRGVLMMPQRTLVSAAVSSLFLCPETSGFFRWTHAAAASPTCLREAGGTMFMGTAVGSGLMYYDATNAYDVASTFTGTIDTPIIHTADGAIIDRVEIVATQTSGGTWTVSRLRKDTGTYDTGGAKTFTPTTVKASWNLPFTGGTGVRAAHLNGLRILMPNDGVGCKLFRIIIHLKSGIGAADGTT